MIVDDVSYFEEPFFQEGPVAVAVSKVTEQGVAYFSSAGNNNLINGGQDIASWEAPQFRDAESCPSGLTASEAAEEIFLNASHCMDFDPRLRDRHDLRDHRGRRRDPDRRPPVGGTMGRRQHGPRRLPARPGGSVVAAGGEDNPATGRPVEVLGWENEGGSAATVQLVINRFGGGLPRLKVALLQNGGGVSATEYEASAGGDVVGPTIFGHNGAEHAISVGAIRYSAAAAPESYSSRGPVTHYFGPVNGAAAAAPLGTPAVLSKPDLTATDCGVTTFFAFESAGKWRFCGTSAAAPHAAGVAALMLQRDVAATPSQIKGGLADTAKPIGAFGADAVGAGLVDAVGALESVPAEGGPEEEGEGEGEVGTVTAAMPPPAAPVKGAFVGAAPKPSPPPTTFFRRRPPRLTLTRRHSAKLTFRFGSDQGAVTFLCKVDRGRFHRCKARFVRRYRLGRHVLRVKARRNSDRSDRRDACRLPVPGQASAARPDQAPPLAPPPPRLNPHSTRSRPEVCLGAHSRESATFGAPLPRRITQWPTRSRASRAAALPRTSGSVRLRPSSRVPK